MPRKPPAHPAPPTTAPDPGTPAAMIHKPAVQTGRANPTPRGKPAVTDSDARRALIAARNLRPDTPDQDVDTIWRSLTPQTREQYRALIKPKP
ncbi:MAG: hypothetical protein AAGI54_00700 [Planctomycetota bacterium]